MTLTASNTNELLYDNNTVVYKDLKANKAKYTSPMTLTASDVNELLCDNHSNHAGPHVFFLTLKKDLIMIENV